VASSRPGDQGLQHLLPIDVSSPHPAQVIESEGIQTDLAGVRDFAECILGLIGMLQADRVACSSNLSDDAGRVAEI
jgi:hypothetical protein